jgi:hypothetical protein
LILVISNAKSSKFNVRENKMNTITSTMLSPSPSLPSAAKAPAAFTQFLATVLLAAGVSALLVVTDRWLDGWADAHRIGAWLALWAVAVVAIVLLRGLTRVLAHKLMVRLDAWSAQLARRRADQRLWEMAQSDPRMMRDLEVALDRVQAKPATVQHLESLMTRRAARLLRDRLYYI